MFDQEEFFNQNANNIFKTRRTKSEEKNIIKYAKNIADTYTKKLLSDIKNIDKDKSKENNNKDIIEKNSFLEFSSTYSFSNGNYLVIESNQIKQRRMKSRKNLIRIILPQEPIEKPDEIFDLEPYDLERSETHKEFKYEINSNNIFEDLKDVYNVDSKKSDNFLYSGLGLI